MKRYILILALCLNACSERFMASERSYLREYQGVDVKFKNEPENLNATQADDPVLLDPYSSPPNWADEQLPPPNKSPFELETFHGDKTSFNSEPVPLKKVAEINNDKLFAEILKCYPTESLFDGELKFQATASPIKSNDREYDNYYAKIVWEMPLYSSSEVSRRVDRENQRRVQTADILANFSESLARKNQALRLVSLYRNLEKRSQARVQKGLVEASEQIGFLEKTAHAHTELLKAKSDVLKYRLQLVSLCTDQKAPKLNELLIKIAGD